jgi:D-tyrosyl-tRNA(Tyr) deacylase
MKAAKLKTAIQYYQRFLDLLEFTYGKRVQTGVFGADMKLTLTNDGPVTIFIDSKIKE